MVTFAMRMLCAVLLVAASLGACANLPELPKSPSGYTSLVVGDEYEYRTSGGSSFKSVVLEVAGPIATERNVYKNVVFTRWADLLYLRDGDMTYQYETNLEDFFPLTVGKTLELRSSVNGRPVPSSQRLSVLRKERVKVPAGEFDAFVIVYCWERVGRVSGCTTRWYVPELGRWVRYEEIQTDKNGTRSIWVELVSLPPRLAAKATAQP